MFRERVARHYQAAGWAVQVGPPALPGSALRPDLLLRKGERSKAVLAFEEPPGPFRLAEFGSVCRKAKIGGIVVGPDDARVAELCEQAGLEFVAGESMGETVVVGRAPPPVPIAVPRPVVEVPMRSRPALGPVLVPSSSRRAWLRWTVVALIWTAAIALATWDLLKLLTG